MAQIRVGVVEDQPLFRELLARSLASHAELDVVMTAEGVKDARAALDQLAQARHPDPPVDALVVDLELPDGNGIGLAVQLRRAFPATGIVALTNKEMLDVVERLPEHQRRPWSYLRKTSTDLQRLRDAVWASTRGIPLLDPPADDVPRSRDSSSIEGVRGRRLEVLALVAEGLTNEAIAERMGLSVNSVVNYLSAVYQILEIPEDANPRVEATLRYLRAFRDPQGHESMAT